MEGNKWGIWTLGILFGAACLAHIYNVFRGTQINVVVPEGHDVNINEPTFELDTTIRAPAVAVVEEGQE